MYKQHQVFDAVNLCSVLCFVSASPSLTAWLLLSLWSHVVSSVLGVRLSAPLKNSSVPCEALLN